MHYSHGFNHFHIHPLYHHHYLQSPRQSNYHNLLFLSLSHTFTVLAPVELRFIPNLLVGKVGVNRDESGWKRRKIQHQHGVSRCSYGVCKIRLRFHYDSCRQRYDSPRWSYECSRMLTVRPRFDTVLLRFKPVAPRQRQDILRMCTI